MASVIPPRPLDDPALRAVQRLRDLHRANAAFSVLTGAVVGGGARWLAGQLDVTTLLLPAAAAGLAGWAGLLVWLAVAPAGRLVARSPLVAAADLAWVGGSGLLVAAREPTNLGLVLIGATAAVVAGFGAGGWWFARRATRAAGSPDRREILYREVSLGRPVAEVWPMVNDADLYASLAPNLAGIVVNDDATSRQCTDTKGNTWTEAMHLDHARHIQQIHVDPAQHPMALTHLDATISVNDDGAASRVELAFRYVTERTLAGLATSLVLPLLGRRLLAPIALGWRNHGGRSDSCHAQPGVAR